MSEISSPAWSRDRYALPSSEASSSSAASWVSTYVMEGSYVGVILKSGGSAVFVSVCNFLPI